MSLLDARFNGERGYAMAALLVAMSVMAIALSTALPVFQTVARREKEAELVFRGEQYARAIGLFQRKYGNALPPTVEALLNERFLRKQYKDPITGGDFAMLGPGSPELAAALSAPPQQGVDAARGGGPGRGASLFGRGATGGAGTSPSGQITPPVTRAPMTAAGQAANQQAAGGIMAVASKSTQTSLRLYNGKSKYNEWVFMAVQASLAAGAPPGSGAQTPGGRGGAAPGGRRGVPAPGGGPGRGFGPAPGTGGRGGMFGN